MGRIIGNYITVAFTPAFLRNSFMTVISTAEKTNEMWTRLVRVVWVAQDPWEKYAPQTKNVIGDFLFKGGNLISTNAPSIVLNLDALK